MSKREVNKEDFEKFRTEFLRCVKVLNLSDWHVDFSFEPLKDNYAQIETQPELFMALVKFNSSRLGRIDSKFFDPELLARHEVSHLFHSRLIYFGKCRFIIPDTFSEEDERLCRVMEKLLRVKM